MCVCSLVIDRDYNASINLANYEVNINSLKKLYNYVPIAIMEFTSMECHNK